jgi:hypothetical protein
MLELNQSGLNGNLGLHDWMSEPSSWLARRNLSIKGGYNYTNASEYVSKNLDYLEEAR